jgi:hypothetical protein
MFRISKDSPAYYLTSVAKDEPLTVDIDQIAWRQARHSLAK